MTARRSASFGTYFFVGSIGMLIGSVIGNVLVRSIFRPGAITRLINLYGFAEKLIIQVGGQVGSTSGYIFTLNLIAIIGIVLAIYIYRRI